ncbi:hypothetical protein [Bordetella hinzii]|uniref:hypothetical protein n=1 Tax=Bordetella hinzii TaxID=103855 RepID=UPI001F10DC1A|nr:hypothetical protein [Bordetella hinzii]
MPELLLLDEPAAGLNPAETEALTGLIAKLRDKGLDGAADRTPHGPGHGHLGPDSSCWTMA